MNLKVKRYETNLLARLSLLATAEFQAVCDPYRAVAQNAAQAQQPPKPTDAVKPVVV